MNILKDSIMSKDYKFPLLMRSTATGLIVLMEGYSTIPDSVSGTVTSSGNGHSTNKVGDYREDWYLRVFKPFEPKIAKTKE